MILWRKLTDYSPRQIWRICVINKIVIFSRYYRQAIGALLVYDIARRETFEGAVKWLEQLREYSDREVVVLLVGNKSDLRHLRCVWTEEAQQFARRW